MKKEELDSIEKSLLEKKAHLEKAREEIEILLKNERRQSAVLMSGGRDEHISEDASEIFEREKMITDLKEIEYLLQALKHAIYKLESKPDKVGFCELCGNFIENPRFVNFPWARFCVKCQEKRERGGR